MNKILESFWKRLVTSQSIDSPTIFPDTEKEKRLIKDRYIRWINRQFLNNTTFLKFDDDLSLTKSYYEINWISYLCDKGSVNDFEQLPHTWSKDDKSINIKIKPTDPFTFHRNPVANSTDSIRGKVGYSNGIHIWKIRWPENMRGTHAVVGVATEKSLLQFDGYVSLVGYDDESWGWDIVSCKKVHGKQFGNPINLQRYPDSDKINPKVQKVPENIYVVLNMFNGTLSYMASNTFLGIAHKGLQGKTLYPAVSAVWGHSEITLRYFNYLSDTPPSLKSLCIYQVKRLLNFHCRYNKVSGRHCRNKYIADIDHCEDFEKAVRSRNIPRVLQNDLLKKNSLSILL